MSNQNSNHCHKQRFLLQTLDPVHVGTGGNRLGRVDLSIVREPGTRLPKIPGTSLHGAIRQYAAVCYESLRCAGAGQGNESKGKEPHCRDAQCPVCYTFGYMNGQDGGQSGQISISDARLLLFPVYSLAGPVWVTSPSILSEFGVPTNDPCDQVCLPDVLTSQEHLNLGWLMLAKASDPFNWPDAIKGVPVEITSRAVLVSDKLFSQIVNSNLEVRTSVSIDPETGAAVDKALFTYEAIPRATILWMDVIEDDFRGVFPGTDKKCRTTIDEKEGTKKKTYEHNAGDPLIEPWNRPLDVVKSALKLAEMLGIGGMGTRGFGRVRLLNEGSES
ncbi:CRISPR-associated RAMP protein, Cmr4 family [Chlorobium limicola DSM 245]|uniref:CRISPR-associated RAMP protein, Cmr4 family n=1 Tax=Chlorobium limicola (strain DSM 245 / NBRC 103803 / 6330) TaxID=290315 RepID=B3EIS1_CHLL2|nr:RAMP superfamily CRISPR-associated protein [Chlorobium limicola]ACD90012.1 CRISPR-associated RAMP protein, Cmr4 family [Chlorobium limicola DSM 245]